jgi:hypothetical protein
MKYKNTAWVILLFSGSLVCSEGKPLKSFNVELERKVLDKMEPGVLSFQQNNKKYNFCEWIVLGAVSTGWFMSLYSITLAPKK